MANVFDTRIRPFPKCPKPLLQSEVECKAIDIKMIFYSHANETHYHKKGFALSLVFKARIFELGNALLSSLLRLLLRAFASLART